MPITLNNCLYHVTRANYTVYRKRSGQAIRVQACPITEIPEQTCQEWGNYRSPLSYKAFIQNLPPSNRMPFAIYACSSNFEVPFEPTQFCYGLIEKDRLHAYILGFMFGAEVSVLNLFVAPWNYLGKFSNTPLNRLSTDAAKHLKTANWQPRPDDMDIAISGAGWTLLSILGCACRLIEITQPTNEAGIEIANINPEERGFYEKVVGAECKGNSAILRGF